MDSKKLEVSGLILLESLQNLDKTLRALCSGLLVIKGKPEIEIPKIVKQI